MRRKRFAVPTYDNPSYALRQSVLRVESKISIDAGNQIIASIGVAARIEETTVLRERIESIELTLKSRAKK